MPRPSESNMEDLISITSSQDVYISYSWSEESRSLMEDLEEVFRERDVSLRLDVHEIPYKGRIKEFMQRLGKGQVVIVVLSKNYLQSVSCMFELVEVYKNKNFLRRVFPVVMPDAKIFKPLERLEYIKYWEKEIKEFDQKLKEVGSANLQGFYEDINTYTEIRNYIAQLMDWLRDMNLMTAEYHQKTSYRDLLQAVIPEATSM